jgi:hypothetical protein
MNVYEVARDTSGAGEARTTIPDNFELHAENTTCNAAASTRGLWKGGHSLNECLLACDTTDDCLYATLSATGYCRFWRQCDGGEAQDGTVAYIRNVPPVDVAGFSLEATDTKCGENATQATFQGPWGKDHTAVSCLKGCVAEDCNYVTVSNKGHCRYWSACDATVQEYASGARIFVKA